MVSNRIFDNAGELYNVTLILDESKNREQIPFTGLPVAVAHSLLPRPSVDVEKYQAYSKPYMAASNLVLVSRCSVSTSLQSLSHFLRPLLLQYAAFFAIYSATIVHTILYNRKEISTGFVTAYRSIRAGQKGCAPPPLPP